MIKTEHFDKLEISHIEQLRAWLMENHEQTESVWLVTFMKNNPAKYVSRWEVLDELICFGWIDGIRRKLDTQRTMQLISKRRVEHWAQSYKLRAQAMIEAGRMHESGLQSIATSKTNGLWDFMNDVDQLIVPEDLASALETQPDAANFFHAINPSSKRFVLRWLKLAKTAATRQKRIATLVELSAKGQKLPGS